jgi:hypothetical protein
MKKRFYINSVILALIMVGCNSSPDYDPNEIPLTPYGIKVKANSGNTFTLSYYIQNEENTFDGYNLYITREPSVSVEKTANLKAIAQPYTTTGSSPTIPHSSSEIDLNTPGTIAIETFMISQKNLDGSISKTFLPFESGTRYYFKLTAHTFYEQESVYFSNEVSAVAIP